MSYPDRNPKSTASIAGHPIHPMLIPFPIVLFIGAFFCDLAYWGGRDPEWVTASIWLLGTGLLMAALAAVVGAIDLLGDARIRAFGIAWWHAGANVLAVLIELYNWYARLDRGADAVLPTGLILSAVVVGLLLFSGWLGGHLVYKHRVGVADSP